MGITPNEVRHAINYAVVDVPSDQKDDCRLAHDGRIKAVYNPTTYEVVTVFWVAHEWLPDRYQPPEQQMSGWVNLDARGAEKLLEAWGFQIHSQKDKANLWKHPDDPAERLIPFSIPARGAKANGKSSFRTAAQVCGVSVAVFLKGPTEEALLKIRDRRILAEVAAAELLLDAPDPMGVNLKLAQQAADRIAVDVIKPVRVAPAESATAEEIPVPVAYSPVDEKVLAALLEAHEPISARALSVALDIHDVTARDALRKLESTGMAFRVGKGASKTGVPPALWWHEAAYSPPTHKETPVQALVQSALTREAEASVALDKGDGQTQPVGGSVIDLVQPTAPTATMRVFEETEIKWPTGGIVIKDDAGNLYVARALTEEGR